MTKQPQFRLVLRGYDPDEVAAKIAQLDHALGIARRTAADRTMAMTQAQESASSLRTQLDDALTRLDSAQDEKAAASRYSELGPRVTSMLRLATQEAEQIRADSERYAAGLRERAENDRDLAASQRDARLAESRQDATALVAEATESASRITDAARVQTTAQLDQARTDLAWATEHRRHVTDQLREIVALIDRLDTELSEQIGSADRDTGIPR